MPLEPSKRYLGHYLTNSDTEPARRYAIMTYIGVNEGHTDLLESMFGTSIDVVTLHYSDYFKIKWFLPGVRIK